MTTMRNTGYQPWKSWVSESVADEMKEQQILSAMQGGISDIGNLGCFFMWCATKPTE